ncbi:centrosome and spindle pole-associated protein 1-like isoform X7 [Mya arenaria]|uniref:centrosome and spindle pole-associated protein 1-like isoform X7 n=1 Tax=Mya arenaria TaxID=6604 RepID=UPI0022E66F88|nr:centrosome and spindle pole-associated protein 1-like isoform X7 [Mya arenaria]
MGTLVETDIDQFIRANKHKLEEEKAELNHYPDQRHVDRGGQNVSPGGRRQWDKNQGRPPRPAEEPRPAPQQETGLAFGNDNQAKRKQQLNAERQKEYNEMLAKGGKKQLRRPRTPSNEGLPLGQYDNKRKALEKERNDEMRQAMASKSKPGAKVFDYTEVEKEHMAEKRREYNEYLLKKQGQHSRHIITPERGMFVGADQTDRDKQAREKMLAYKQELEQQQQQQLLYKARQLAHIPDQSSRTNQIIKQSGPPPRSLQGQGYTGDERVKDMPKDSTRRIEAEHGGQSKRPPIFAENGPNYNHDDGERVFYKREEQRGRERERDERVGHRERDGENYQRHNERRHFPPQEVMRSRSLSPPLRDRGRRSPQGERSQRYLEDLEKRQQVLQEEYRRQLAEEQRLSAAQQETGLPLGVDGARAKLEEERKREYNQYLAAKNAGPQGLRIKEPTPEHLRLGLPLDQQRYNWKKHQLETERQREYNEFIQKHPATDRSRASEVLEGKGATLNVGEYDDNRRRHLEEERHQEYVQQQQQKQLSDRSRGLPPKPATPNHFFNNMGQHDRQAQVLQEERKKEYNQKLREGELRTGARRAGAQPDSFAAGLQISGKDSAEIRKIKARNEEYNEYMREKTERDRHRFDDKKPATQASGRRPSPPRGNNPKEFATLPGLHYTDSAEKRKMADRNREYNDFLKQKDQRKRRFSTPTYEEILDQKRREEELARQEQGGNLRRYASEGNINKFENEMRDRELNKEFEARKVRFGDERKLPSGILDDDNWLHPDHREEEYHQLVEPPPRPQPEMATSVQPKFMGGLNVGATPAGLGGNDERDSAKRRRQAEYRRELQFQMEETQARKKREKVQDLRVNASGLLDPEKTSNRIRGLEGVPGASPRREYKAKEVQPYHTRFLLDDRGDFDALGRSRGSGGSYQQPPTTSSHLASYQGVGLGTGGLGGLGLGSGGLDEGGAYLDPVRSAPPLRGILTHADRDGRGGTPESADFGENLQLDLGGGGGRERGRRRERDNPLSMDPGFMGLLESRRPMGIAAPPPGLMYQPSTYVTGGGGGLGGLGSVDEAYNYYAMKNPLEDLNGGGGGYVPSLNLGGGGQDYGRADYGGRSPMGQRVTFADDPPTNRQRDRSKERISPYHFASEQEQKTSARRDTESYGAELARQIEEKRRQKAMEKAEQRRYDQKLEDEIKNYNPFGRGGGGAPIRDEGGNAIADLRAVQRGTYQSPRSSRRASPQSFSPRPPSPRDDKIKPPPAQQTAQGESTYARGGHGIFGMPKTDAEKDASDKYKDELRDQIAEKRRLQQMEKERERMEEERENKRLEDQRLRMQSEYEEEQKKIRAREEEARRKNEELKLAAEERKKEAQRKNREQDDAKMKQQQEDMEREKREREQRENEASERLKSPPVPAMKAKYGGGQPGINMYTIYQPSPAPGPSNRPPSSDVLTQLASMRKQLQSERRRVENALENSKNEPDVFDPRTIQRPPPTTTEYIERNKVIFENAVNKNASLPPPRPSTDTVNARNIQQFNELKYKTDTESRRALRSMFPEAPVTNNTLETQQEAMLRQQEEQLRSLRERILTEKERKLLKDDSIFSDDSYEPKIPYIIRDGYDPTPSNMSYGRKGNVSARSQLASNSAFIDVDNINHFPEDFEDMTGARNDTARARRRERFSPRPSSINGMGSQASLDVDRIQLKNEDRLRRLHQMSSHPGDDISMADPDDILDRFMAKQRYNRPPSGQTLQDDTWMRPGSKVV